MLGRARKKSKHNFSLGQRNECNDPDWRLCERKKSNSAEIIINYYVREKHNNKEWNKKGGYCSHRPTIFISITIKAVAQQQQQKIIFQFLFVIFRV